MDLRLHRLDLQPTAPVLEECYDRQEAEASIDAQAFYIIRSLARPQVECRRVQRRRDRVLLDGYEGKPLARLNLQHLPHQVVLYPAGEPRCYEVDGVNDIYDLADVLRASVAWYEREYPVAPAAPEREVMA